MENYYTEQEITMLIAGLRMLIEREKSLVKMTGETGAHQIQYSIKKYRFLLHKLESEV